MSKLSILKQKNKRDVDMTQGSIFRHLITFAFPLLIGNIFQQLYNTVDTWVVGNYVSNEAFSAVGTVGPVINMLIGIFLGLSSGAGVVISQYYGAKRYDKVRDTVHTSIVMTLILAVLFTIIGIAMIPFVLNFMKTPRISPSTSRASSALCSTTWARAFCVPWVIPSARSISLSSPPCSTSFSISSSCCRSAWALKVLRMRPSSRRASPPCLR